MKRVVIVVIAVGMAAGCIRFTPEQEKQMLVVTTQIAELQEHGKVVADEVKGVREDIKIVKAEGDKLKAEAALLEPELKAVIEKIRAMENPTPELLALKAKYEEREGVIKASLETIKSTVAGFEDRKETFEAEAVAIKVSIGKAEDAYKELRASGVPWWKILGRLAVEAALLAYAAKTKKDLGVTSTELGTVSAVLGVVSRAADVSGTPDGAPDEFKAAVTEACKSGEATTTDVRKYHHLATDGQI